MPAPGAEFKSGVIPLTIKQRTAIAAPVVLMGTMYPVFRVLDSAFGDQLDGYLGWYLGLVTYWIVWGAGFSIWILGLLRIRQLIRPRRPTIRLILPIAFQVYAAPEGLFKEAVPDGGGDQ